MNPQRPKLGANVLEAGGVEFTVWSPESASVDLILSSPADAPKHAPAKHAMKKNELGYFSVTCRDAHAGDCYKFSLGQRES